MNKEVKVPLKLIEFDKKLLKCPTKYKHMYDFWYDFIFDPAANKIAITDRGTGKTKNVFLIILASILTDNEFFSAFLMRNFDDNTEQTRPLLIQILDEFCFEIFQGQAVEEKEAPVKLNKDGTPSSKQPSKKQLRGKWEVVMNADDNMKVMLRKQERQRACWDAYYRGIEYEGIPRGFFLNLERPSKSRGAVNKPCKLVILDECMPSKEDNKQKRDKGRMWIPNEAENFTMIYDSIRRGEIATKMFTGNPNRPWLEGWYFFPFWEETLEEWTKWYWANRPTSIKAWKEWTWIKSARMGDKYLKLQKCVHEEQEYPSPETNNWDNFFKKREELKILKKFLNGSQPLYMFNECIMFWAKDVKERDGGIPAHGFWFFVHRDYPYIANRGDPEFWDNLPEHCYTVEQESNSLQKRRVKMYLKMNTGTISAPKLSDESAKKYRLELLGKKNRNQLWFVNDGKSREIIMEFINNGKYI